MLDKLPKFIEVDRRLYEIYLDFIGQVRRAEKSAEYASDLEKMVVDAIDELDEKVGALK
jgi:hypothetical protein